MFDLLRFPGGLFDELDRLHREVNQLFYDSAASPSGIRAVGRGAFPAVNMGGTPDTVEIYAFAPGIEPDKLEIFVDRGLLTIAGERQAELPENEKQTVYARERFAGQFKRVITLPEDVDQNQVEARYQNGVLHITAAKQEASKPRRVEVK